MAGTSRNILIILLSIVIYKSKAQENGVLQGDQQVVASSPVTVDQSAAESGYGHDGGHKGSDFFMYAHQPSKKEYEFGFKRGNDHHTMERYEKAGPHHNFKTKVRWSDNKGGHGEHYWDYNHAPKYHDDHGHNDHGHDDHGGYGHDDHHDDGYGHDGGHGDHGGYGHDDHSDHGGYGHDDHGDHGGYGHDDHSDHGGYGHDDHGGYHSQPVPDYAPVVAASDRAGAALTKIASSRSLPSKEYTSTDTYRKVPGKVDQTKSIETGKKDTGLGKKKYRKRVFKKMVMKVTNSSDTAPKPFEVKSHEEAPSAFPAMLGFNPYQPPVAFQETHNPSSSHSSIARTQNYRVLPTVIAEEDHIPSSSDSITTNKSRTLAPKIVPSPLIPDLPSASAPVKKYRPSASAPVKKYSTQIKKNSKKPTKNNKGKNNGNYSTFSKYMSRKTYSTHTDFDSDDEIPTQSPPSDSDASASSLTEEEVSGLAFDLESGRIFNHKTGKWYTLVPVQKQ